MNATNTIKPNKGGTELLKARLFILLALPGLLLLGLLGILADTSVEAAIAPSFSSPAMPQAANCALENLLTNPGFEAGTIGPDAWAPFPPPGPGITYTWDATTAVSGTYSVAIEITGTSRTAMWRQVVNVTPGTVYRLAGHVRLENVVGDCHLQAVFRDSDDNILEFVALPGHSATIAWLYDFPHEINVRAPAGAATAEVNLFLQGTGKVWFDEVFFGPAPAGTIAGQVTSGGQPLSGVQVAIWGSDFQAVTDEEGHYVIPNVPDASPRYILIASKAGYRDQPPGDVDVVACQTTTVDFDLEPGSNLEEPELRVKFGSLALAQQVPPPTIPTDAVISPTLYPAAVQPYLVLADGPGGLELLSAPATIPLTVGHVAYLPVQVQGYYRPITVTAQTFIHTYVNDVTPAEPGVSPSFTVGTLTSSQGELKLQTLRMRAHPLTLAFVAGHDQASVPLTLTPGLQRWAPVFGAGFIPACSNCEWGGLSEPYTQADGVYGNDCRPCAAEPGEFRPSTPAELECIKSRQQADPTFQCRCRLIRQVFNAEEADRIRTNDALAIQRYASQVLRHQIGWSARQPYPTTITNTYLLEGLDWIFRLPPQKRDYSPLINDFMEGIGGWMACPDDYPMVVNTASGGSIGFYDEDNAALVDEYRRYVQELAARFGPELHFLETMNEPCYGFYLCPCRGLDGPGYPCQQTWPRGPDHQVCDDLPPGYFQPHQTQEFADVYAEFLFHSADIAAEELENAGSDALLVTGALELTGAGLTETTEKMIRLGLLERDNVAFMIHQFPYPSPPDWITHEECVYGPGWSLPPGCETAPPFQDYITPGGRPVAARTKWQGVDEAIDVSEILSDVYALGGPNLLDRFRLFDTELHGGFGIKDETTNAGRTAIAGLRIGAINAHQRFAGSLFISNNSDPAPYNTMVRHLVGVTPVYRPAWNAPLTGTNYAGLVYKLFTRGNEDIIAVWSNATATVNLKLSLSGAPTQFKQVTLTRVYGPECPTVDCAGLTPEERSRVDITSQVLSAPPASIPVQPLQEFYFLSVISDEPGFGWLGDVSVSWLVHLPLLMRDFSGVGR